jgi:hypothetical protein
MDCVCCDGEEQKTNINTVQKYKVRSGRFMLVCDLI